ncbi:MAG TPA: pyrroline-5-carboxylate reductase, partial [Elusimicrobiota bacterium]|nr:pyrroline-5-carboxylate reductase [Elusimicrobiota bacterium]
MGGALVGGLLAARTRRAADVVVVEIDGARRRELKKKWGVGATDDPRTAVRGADAVVLAVKPQQMPDLLGALAGAVRPSQVMVSVAAGVTTASIENALGPVPVVRAMPNTPALIRAGAMVYCLGRFARAAHETRARKILSAVGPVWKVEEKDMDAVTALSGSGPAYVFYLAEAMAAAGAALGLDPALAESLARQTVYGAGRLLAESADPAGELRRKVTSPGGTTQAALAVLEAAGVIPIFEKALDAARRRSSELSSSARGSQAPKESNP